VKISSIAVFLAVAHGTAAFGEEAPSYLGSPDCKVELVPPEAVVSSVSWQGQCRDGYAEGKGVLAWRAGEKSQKYRLEATLARGVIQGEATLSEAHGAAYIGSFKNGVPNGMGTFRYPNGMQYQGAVRNGTMDGEGKAFLPNGDRYQGQWKDGKPDGSGHMEYMLGGEYEGEWKLGKRHGQGTLTYAGSGRRYTGWFVDDRIEGSPPLAVVTETYSLKSDAPSAPWHRKEDIVRSSPVPLDIGYGAFTPEQKRLFNSFYPALEDGDEPPYPLHPQEFHQQMANVTGILHSTGNLRIFALVDANGSVESVSVMGLVDENVKQIAGYAASQLKYKPALCRGQPCPMMFEFALHLKTVF
jgi:hypothetical protein